MRLAIVQAGLGAGGTERVVSLIVADRCNRGDEVHVLAFGDEHEESYFPLHPLAIVHRLPGPKAKGTNPWRSLLQVRQLRQELRKVRPELVVSFLTKINILCLLATRGLEVPVIISERNNPSVQRKNFVWRLAAPLVQGRAARLVVQTVAILKTLPEPLRQRSIVIGNPCDKPVERLSAPREELRVVAVGRLVEQKGFDILIAAFGKIAAETPEWSLSIYGYGPLRAELQRQIDSLQLQARVVLHGISTKPGGWTDKACLFVLSSRYEGFPNVLIEAMAAGIPVVSTGCDYGPKEIVTDGVSGLLVPVDDVEALSAAMRRLMSEPSLRAKFAVSATEVINRFSTDAVMSRWDTCLREVAAAGARR